MLFRSLTIHPRSHGTDGSQLNVEDFTSAIEMRHESNLTRNCVSAMLVRCLVWAPAILLIDTNVSTEEGTYSEGKPTGQSGIRLAVVPHAY